jgi:5'(3')-deoxyribonucleotidase
MFYPDLYLDVDGVFADYEGEYRRLSGADPSEKGKQKAMRFKTMPHFYLNLPLLPDAMQLWAFVKHFNPAFLTASSNFQKTSKEDKETWLKHHFHVPEDRIIVVPYPKDKWKHCKKGAILVDDKLQNCTDWEHAGGIAIHHTSAHRTIDALKQILQRENYTAAHHVIEAFQQLYVEPPTDSLLETFDKIWQEAAKQNVTEIVEKTGVLDGY